MKKGLVLEGGAMRGMFTCGVIDVFLEENIEFDGMAGTSAGAIFGSNFKSKQIKRGLRYNLKYGRDKRYASIENLIRTGDYYGRDFAYHAIPNRLDKFDTETYKTNPLEFYVCVTDIETGEPVYFKSETGDAYDIEWIRASASMPLFAKPVEIDGRKLMDGGITDSIPLKFMEEKGFEKNVVILTQPESYRKQSNKAMPIMKVAYRKYPKMLEAMEYRHFDYNSRVEYIRKQEEKGSVFVIAPEESLGISRIESNPKELLKAYKKGRRMAKSKLSEVQRFLLGE